MILQAFHDAWRFWGDGNLIFDLTIDELEGVLKQATRIVQQEQRAARNQ